MSIGHFINVTFFFSWSRTNCNLLILSGSVSKCSLLQTWGMNRTGNKTARELSSMFPLYPCKWYRQLRTFYAVNWMKNLFSHHQHSRQTLRACRHCSRRSYKRCEWRFTKRAHSRYKKMRYTVTHLQYRGWLNLCLETCAPACHETLYNVEVSETLSNWKVSTAPYNFDLRWAREKLF